MRSTASVDMLHGPLTRELILFALPIAASSMLQQLFNSADTAVVGRFADASALAAVGTNTEIVALLVSLSAGLAVGANVLLARQIGSGQLQNAASAIRTALAFALLFGLSGAVLGQCISRPLLVLIHTPETILNAAVCYLRLYFLGMPALLLYDFGAAILRSRGDSRRPFLILIASGALNLGLNLLFVIVFRLDVAGVALATGLSNAFSAAAVLWLLAREPEPFRLRLHITALSGSSLPAILQIGIPAALQGAVFCLANIFVQNRFGASTTAGSAIAANFEYFGYYMITAFGQAATTFTSQNHAAGNPARCRAILLRCLAEAVLFSAAVTVPLTLFRTQAAGLFSSDAAVVQAACLRILLILSLEPICSLYEVPAGYLRGLGFSALPAALMVLGICSVRILWVILVFPQVQTLTCLYSVFPLSWGITTLLLWGGLLWCQKKTIIPQDQRIH